MTGPRIAVVDHGAGNLVSIARGLERTGAEVNVATRPEEAEGAGALVLPGVGATAAVMEGIRSAGFEQLLLEWNRPLLGICVGMQVLFGSSTEDGADCLGLLPGVVRRLEGTPRLPHIGWNDLRLLRPDPLFSGVDDGSTFYFVHSFAPDPQDEAHALATSEYGKPFVAAVRSGARWGVQFHPERSGDNGLRVLSNFVSLVPA